MVVAAYVHEVTVPTTLVSVSGYVVPADAGVLRARDDVVVVLVQEERHIQIVLVAETRWGSVPMMLVAGPGCVVDSDARFMRAPDNFVTLLDQWEGHLRLGILVDRRDVTRPMIPQMRALVRPPVVSSTR